VLLEGDPTPPIVGVDGLLASRERLSFSDAAKTSSVSSSSDSDDPLPESESLSDVSEDDDGYAAGFAGKAGSVFVANTGAEASSSTVLSPPAVVGRSSKSTTATSSVVDVDGRETMLRSSNSSTSALGARRGGNFCRCRFDDSLCAPDSSSSSSRVLLLVLGGRPSVVGVDDLVDS
jgi:hypothetical protein